MTTTELQKEYDELRQKIEDLKNYLSTASILADKVLAEDDVPDEDVDEPLREELLKETDASLNTALQSLGEIDPEL